MIKQWSTYATKKIDITQDLSAFLNSEKRSCICKALGDSIQEQAAEVEKYLGRPRPYAFWVVAMKTGLPRKYKADEFDMDFLVNVSIAPIEDAKELRRLLLEFEKGSPQTPKN
ncbi:MAG: hypothetical protein OXE94_12325 [Aestuariivita sp.]|nr:hypothetical protein [Aestuariivita sp.]